MTRSQIEYVLTLSDLKNFGKAAEACFVTQSTLSAMVAKFEEQVGVQIFNRRTRPITITPQGSSVLKSLKSVYREFQLLDEQLNTLKGIELGALRIACIPTVAPYIYPLILNRITEVYPKVHFTIHELTTEHIVDEIINGGIDIGIVSIPLEHKELIEYPIYEEDFLIYDCGDQLESKQYRISDIDIDRLWLLEEGHCLRNQVGKICELRQQKKVVENLIYNCGSIFTLIEMVKMNKGVTLLPRLAVVTSSHVEPNRIFELSKPIPSRKIGLVSHKNFLKKDILNQLVRIIGKVVTTYLPVSSSDRAFLKPF